MPLPKFEYLSPKSLEEALQLLADRGEGTHLLAGGTDLLVKMAHGHLKPRAVIALKQIDALGGIRFDPGKGLFIGATALLDEVASHPDVKAHFPSVAYAAQQTANVQIRNMGTLAGNLCNAAPSADNAPVLTAMGAEAVIAGPKGERRVALDRFFKGPGQTVIEPGEILTAVHVPVIPSGFGTSYQHVSPRGKVDIAAVCVGAMVGMDGATCKEARIVLGAVAPVPMRAEKTEALVRGKALTPEILEKAGRQASEEARPISDMRAGAEYRKRMTAVLTGRALKQAAEAAAN
ncbi:MAG: xanthine dehydrogenase family protein subunit M [Deltaproteobacteria bacterium]|nr:xanthine dehydrogenase family protein subunit M [Deltaproteobacteria bacterium]